MEYAKYLGRTGRHLGVVEHDTRGESRPPRRGSWAQMLEAEEAAKERAEKLKEKKS